MKSKDKPIDTVIHSYSRMHIPSQEEAGTESASPKIKKGQKIAVRVISQFGEESTKLMMV